MPGDTGDPHTDQSQAGYPGRNAALRISCIDEEGHLVITDPCPVQHSPGMVMALGKPLFGLGEYCR